MATIKSYTDFEQAEKLKKILPIGSADMYYSKYDTIHASMLYSSCDTQWFNIREFTPCWSLAALLEALHNPDLMYSEGVWIISTKDERWPYGIGGFKNPINACVEMALELHERNLI